MGIADHRAPTDLASVVARVRVDAAGEAVPLAGEPEIVVTLGAEPAPSLDRITAGTACVVAELVLWRWPLEALIELAARLRPDRVLYFVEPTADLGWRQAFHVAGRRWCQGRWGHHFLSDVPAALRATGLVLTTADRFTLGPLGVRSYVWGRAEHIEGQPPFPEV